MWESCFSEVGLHTAQVLLTHEDLGDRHRYLNARTTLKTLVALGTVPVINENDTVVVDEIRFGDNDTLAALVTNLIEGEALVILTDQKGLYSADPRRDAAATLIARGAAGDPALEAMAGGVGSAIGSGGMITKVLAAKRAARSGAHTAIAYGREPDVLVRLFAGEAIGTLLEAQTQPVAARKQWLADHLKPSGRIVLDAGAVKALVADGKSLLAIGATAVDGHFGRGEVVSIVGPDGREIARGLVNYGSAETARILRKPTAEIESVLGYLAEPELIHRDNLVVL
jgi:glutamate 5-kinase